MTELDGFRGLMTLAVILSHYFAELPNGPAAGRLGWLAVDMFFVLSGFLIGRLILDKRDCGNFFTVFYVRRFARIIPAYVLTVIVLWALIRWIDRPWLDAEVQFPLWSYLTFNQVFFMIGADSIGAHWLAPTWTLAFEEHFYLVAPALIVFTPRRWLVPVLLGAAVLAFALRVGIYGFGFGNAMAALVLLPVRADAIVCGVLAAIAVRGPAASLTRLMPVLRVVPLVCLVGVALAGLAGDAMVGMIGHMLAAVGGAAYILCIFTGQPEARPYRSRTLQFFGNNGYCLYLTHLPVLGLMHGLLLGEQPDIATLPQAAVTFAALPVCVLVGWGMTTAIEEPLTRYGRRWRWQSRAVAYSSVGGVSSRSI